VYQLCTLPEANFIAAMAFGVKLQAPISHRKVRCSVRSFTTRISLQLGLTGEDTPTRQAVGLASHVGFRSCRSAIFCMRNAALRLINNTRFGAPYLQKFIGNMPDIIWRL